jgi:hypothetical protein
MSIKKKISSVSKKILVNGDIKIPTTVLPELTPETPLVTSNGNGHGDFGSRELLRVLMEVKNGNFNVRMPIDQVGINGKICDTLNEIISLNEKMMEEFTNAGSTIGKKGKLTERITAPSNKGSWNDGIDALNTLISDLVHDRTRDQPCG